MFKMRRREVQRRNSMLHILSFASALLLLLLQRVVHAIHPCHAPILSAWPAHRCDQHHGSPRRFDIQYNILPYHQIPFPPETLPNVAKTAGIDAPEWCPATVSGTRWIKTGPFAPKWQHGRGVRRSCLWIPGSVVLRNPRSNPTSKSCTNIRFSVSNPSLRWRRSHV